MSAPRYRDYDEADEREAKLVAEIKRLRERVIQLEAHLAVALNPEAFDALKHAYEQKSK